MDTEDGRAGRRDKKGFYRIKEVRVEERVKGGETLTVQREREVK